VRVIGTTRLVDRIRGAVRVEAVYDTDIDDLWKACTTPQRLARWIAEVSGDLPVGGTVHAVFTSTWAGPARVEVCDSPHHLLMTTDPGTDDETQLEAWLTEEALDRAHTGVPEHDGPLMSDRIRLDGTTVNAPDALAPAEFYATITDGIATGTSGWAAVTGPNALIAFQQVDDFRPPTWPSSSVPMQMHLDFLVDDLEATGTRRSSLGRCGSTSSPTPITASCTPTRSAIRSAYPRGGSAASLTAHKPVPTCVRPAPLEP